MGRSPMADLPPSLEELRADAWCGEAARGPLDPDSIRWGLRRDLPKARQALAPAVMDLAQWTDPRVGWGVILPERTDMSGAEKAAGADAPEPIRNLLQARAPAPVLRWDSNLQNGTLRRYDAAGTASEPSLSGARGIAQYAIPHYLLVVATPEEIPWGVQYRLQSDAFVGRLDLDPEGLANYVDALLGNWDAAGVDPRRPVVWAVDHGYPDITRLMRKVVAERLYDRLANDGEFEMNSGLVTDGQATVEGLRQALANRRPAFVVTSSHGATMPLEDPSAMKTQLGLPVDHDRALLTPGFLLADLSTHGAIWYAHACCSAGGDARSRFEGLVGSDSSLGRTLGAIARTGACSAPLPRALLGAPKPLRAFIGHVEPTFDWTLRSPVTGEVISHHIVDALYGQLHLAHRPPVGLAMAAYFKQVGGYLQDYTNTIDDIDNHVAGAGEAARRAKLIAYDRLAMVLLGDPTVCLPRSA
jgi:hypothetical protein